ncbi:MAG: flavin oxidoreductase [Microscillaceae bacterium]|nr:flavin oxidoreductase [Microscillaceae bacterium]
MSPYFRRNFINCLSGFKSLNLVGTADAEGQTNLAPFSQVFHVGASPALLGLLVRPDSVPRHTLANIEATGFYTLNHVRADFVKEAHQTSARYAISEFEACGLTAEFRNGFPAPFVGEAWVQMGLRFAERHHLAINGTILVIGYIERVQIPADCINPDGFIDLEKAGSLTSAGLDAYYEAKKVGRYAYAKPDQPVSEIE